MRLAHCSTGYNPSPSLSLLIHQHCSVSGCVKLLLVFIHKTRRDESFSSSYILVCDFCCVDSWLSAGDYRLRKPREKQLISPLQAVDISRAHPSHCAAYSAAAAVSALDWLANSQPLTTRRWWQSGLWAVTRSHSRGESPIIKYHISHRYRINSISPTWLYQYCNYCIIFSVWNPYEIRKSK